MVKFILILNIIPFALFGQQVIGEDSILMELSVVDTNFYNGEKIYVFDDGSWEYTDQFETVEVMSSKFVGGCLTIPEQDLYSKNWRNHKTFSLTTNLKGVKDSVSINTSGAVKPVDASCNSTFKIRWGKWHQGNDYACATGTPVTSVWGGRVRYAQRNGGGFGNLIIVRHPNGLETYYAHLSKINVKINEDVSAGQVIGLVGNTGHSHGSHLHLEFRFMDNPIDPADVFATDKLLLCSSTFKSMRLTSKKSSFAELFSYSSVDKVETGTALKTTRTRRRRTSSNMD